MRVLGAVWLSILLAGCAVLLYCLSRVKNLWCVISGAAVLTFFAVYPTLIAYMPTFYLVGAFVSLFTFCCALSVLGFRQKSRVAAAVLLVLQLGATGALIFVSGYAFGLYFCFIPVALYTFCRDICRGDSARKFKLYAIALTLAFAAVFPLYNCLYTGGTHLFFCLSTDKTEKPLKTRFFRILHKITF